MSDDRLQEARGRRRPLVGAQIRRLRTDRGLTLAQVGELADLNVGYLSQVENDKASPSLETLAAIADVFEVPITWLLVDAAPAPRVVRRHERRVQTTPMAFVWKRSMVTLRGVCASWKGWRLRGLVGADVRCR